MDWARIRDYRIGVTRIELIRISSKPERSLVMIIYAIRVFKVI